MSRCFITDNLEETHNVLHRQLRDRIIYFNQPFSQFLNEGMKILLALPKEGVMHYTLVSVILLHKLHTFLEAQCVGTGG